MGWKVFDCIFSCSQGVVVPGLPRSSTAVPLATWPKHLYQLFFLLSFDPFPLPKSELTDGEPRNLHLDRRSAFFFICAYFCKIHVFCTRLSEFAGNIDRGFEIGRKSNLNKLRDSYSSKSRIFLNYFIDIFIDARPIQRSEKLPRRYFSLFVSKIKEIDWPASS